MDVNASLYEISKLLLAEEDPDRTAELLLRRVLEATEAERGFIVVREGEGYEQKFDVQFDREQLSAEERKFSRNLVRQALRTREILYSPNLQADARFAEFESVQALGDLSVLVAPLLDAEEVWGVIYLERQGSIESFPEESKRFLTEFAHLAGRSLHRATEREALRRRNRSLEHDLFAQHDFAGILTRDPKMLQLLKMVAQVADSDAAVLILGETGTGKELIARALHLNSGRRGKPFVTLHCAALPATVLESELFGHVKGAFTGAERDRAGRIASAAGGTLFLDEVAEIPAEVQAKLLRFLQFGEIQRVGSDRVEKVDVRVLAATHQDLPALVSTNKFRQDLYFRLKVLELRIPPLRERQGDLPVLLDSFLRKYWRRAGEQPRFTPQAERALNVYAYPGNVRELQHLVERVCLMATGPELGLDLLPPEVLPAGDLAGAAPATAGVWRFAAYTNDELKLAREAAIAEVERQFLDGLMARCEGNVSRASRESGIHRTYLQKLLSERRGAEAGG